MSVGPSGATLVLPHQKQIRLTPASWLWRESIRPTPASWAWREDSRPTPTRLRRVGQESRQQGNPPDPDLIPPNPWIPDAATLAGVGNQSFMMKFQGVGKQAWQADPRPTSANLRGSGEIPASKEIRPTPSKHKPDS